MNIQGMLINFIANLWSVLIIQLELFVRFIERLDIEESIAWEMRVIGRMNERKRERSSQYIFTSQTDIEIVAFAKL